MSLEEAPALGGVRALRTRVETIAGDGLEGYQDGPAAAARFRTPRGLDFDAAGNLYVVDTNNHRIRVITAEGQVKTVAGDGESGCVDGPGHTARFTYPRYLAVDRAGHVYVADTDNDRIRKITMTDPENPVVSTFSGEGVRGFADGPRGACRYHHPNGLAFDADGYLYVADASNRRIRKVSPGGTATTLAGGEIAGYADGPGHEARFNSPRGVAVDALGRIFVADYGNSRIRMLTPDGHVSTFAGDGRGAFADGQGVAASFRDPCDLDFDAAGNLYVVDCDNHCIRKIDPDANVTTIAGDGKGLADYADGPGHIARFSTPRALTVTPAGVVYVADLMNHCIRRITLE
jgi:DNA-binding beta-propeller fold protein YncE